MSKRKSEEKCEKSLPNDFINKKEKSQPFKRVVETLLSNEGITKKKAQNKTYWKNTKDSYKERSFKQKSRGF